MRSLSRTHYYTLPNSLRCFDISKVGPIPRDRKQLSTVDTGGQAELFNAVYIKGDSTVKFAMVIQSRRDTSRHI